MGIKGGCWTADARNGATSIRFHGTLLSPFTCDLQELVTSKLPVFESQHILAVTVSKCAASPCLTQFLSSLSLCERDDDNNGIVRII